MPNTQARSAALELAVLEAKKAGDAEDQRSYQEKFEKLRPAVEYFRMRLEKSGTPDAATKADMMANVLIQSGLEFHTLIDIFEEDRAAVAKKAKKKKKKGLLPSINQKLLQIVGGVYEVHVVPGLSVSDFVECVVGYLNSTVFSATSQTPMGKTGENNKTAKVKRPTAQDIDAARRRLEAATFERYNSYDGGMAHFRANLASLVPLKFYLADNFFDDGAEVRRSAADFVQNLLAFHDQGRNPIHF